MPGLHLGTSSHPSNAISPDSSLLGAWEGSLGQPKALEPYSSEAEVEEALGTWLQTGEAPAIAADWGVSQQMIDLPLCLSSSLYI